MPRRLHIERNRRGPGTKALIDWLIEAGYASDWMKTKDWALWTPGVFMKPTAKDLEEIIELEDCVQRFFNTMTRREIYAGALERRLLLAPVSSVADIAADEQLKARGFFTPVEHDTLGRSLILPGPFAKLSETPIDPPRRAPRLGEHNREVLGELLGMGADRLKQLHAAGAI